MNNPHSDAADRGRHKTWLGWIAGLALVAGLAVGGVALASAVGIWLGLWDFRMGFDMLQHVGVVGQAVTAAALVAAAAVFVLGKRLTGGGGSKLPVLALIGAIANTASQAKLSAPSPARRISAVIIMPSAQPKTNKLTKNAISGRPIS